ncbi:MAG: adenine deaminase, partial [Aquificota bacterium]
MRGKDLSHYLSLGIGSDHETVEFDEGREKLQKGLFIYLREGSSAKNLRGLLPLLRPFNADRFGFATDDLSPRDLAEGHIDLILRKAVALGLDPLLALKVACRNPFVHFRLPARGAVAPGYKADLVFLKDLASFEVKGVIKGGRWAYKDGEYLLPFPGISPPKESPFAVPSAEVLRRKMEVRPKGRRLRAIGLVEGQ